MVRRVVVVTGFLICMLAGSVSADLSSFMGKWVNLRDPDDRIAIQRDGPAVLYSEYVYKKLVGTTPATYDQGMLTVRGWFVARYYIESKTGYLVLGGAKKWRRLTPALEARLNKEHEQRELAKRQQEEAKRRREEAERQRQARAEQDEKTLESVQDRAHQAIDRGDLRTLKSLFGQYPAAITFGHRTDNVCPWILYAVTDPEGRKVSPEMLEYLLDVTHYDISGKAGARILDEAVGYGDGSPRHVALCEVLLKRGVNPNATQSPWGSAALFSAQNNNRAKRNGRYDNRMYVDLLKQYGAKSDR